MVAISDDDARKPHLRLSDGYGHRGQGRRRVVRRHARNPRAAVIAMRPLAIAIVAAVFGAFAPSSYGQGMQSPPASSAAENEPNRKRYRMRDFATGHIRVRNDPHKIDEADARLQQTLAAMSFFLFPLGAAHYTSGGTTVFIKSSH